MGLITSCLKGTLSPTGVREAEEPVGSCVQSDEQARPRESNAVMHGLSEVQPKPLDDDPITYGLSDMQPRPLHDDPVMYGACDKQPKALNDNSIMPRISDELSRPFHEDPRMNGISGVRPSSIYDGLRMHGQETRLITLHPGEFGSPLDITLSVADLKEHLGYEALSYVWGDLDPPKLVVVNQQQFKVTPNLYDALQRLRRTTEPRRLWIDAICINQSDEAEKGHQVNIMRKIYRQASSVVVWLGEFCSEEAVIYDTVKDCCHCDLRALPNRDNCVCWAALCPHRNWTPVMLLCLVAQRYHAGLKTFRSRTPEQRVWEHFESAANRVHPSPESLVHRIYSSAWWTRGWVLQEVLLSQKSPIAMFAANEMPLKALTSFAMVWHNEKVESPYFQRFCRLHLYLEGDLSEMSLYSALRLSTARTMTVGHDYVYGVLALVDDSRRKQIAPDYSKSLSRVYAEAMRVLLQQSGLRWLRLIENTWLETSLDLPSWVCDFSKDPFRTRKPDQCVRHECVRPVGNDWEVLDITAKFLGEISQAREPGENMQWFNMPEFDECYEEGRTHPYGVGFGYKTPAGYTVFPSTQCRRGDELWEVEGLPKHLLVLSKIKTKEQNSDGLRWRQIAGFGKYEDPRTVRSGQSYKVKLV